MSPLTLSVSSHFSLLYFLIRMAADPSCAKQHASPVMAGSDGGCQGRFAKLVVSRRKDSATECSTHLWNPSWLSRKDVCTCRMCWRCGLIKAAVRERRSDIAQHRSGAGEQSRVEQGGAARIEGGRRVCARSDCDSDSGEVQCASMDARLYRGVQASVLRGDCEGWRIRPEQSAARNLHLQGVAQEVGNFDSDGDAWPNESKEIHFVCTGMELKLRAEALVLLGAQTRS